MLHSAGKPYHAANNMRLARQICHRLYADFSSFGPDRQAAAEALASKWAGQVPRRAAEIARLLRG